MPQKLRTLIVDDEPLARAKLRRFLAAEPDIELIGEAGDGRSAIEAIQSLSPDLVFLDVQLPELDGFGVLAELGVQKPPCIIFVTAHDEFAVRAFEAHAIEFLLKPYDQVRFAKALGRARELLHNVGPANNRYAARVSNLVSDVAQQRAPAGRIAVKSGRRIVFLKIDEIDWIEAADNYAVLHAGKERHIMRETMNALETRLDPGRFLRISRSTIVNLDRVQDLEPLFHGEYSVRLQNGTKLTCSRSYRDRLRHLLAD